MYSNLYVDKAEDRLPSKNPTDAVAVKTWHYGSSNTYLTSDTKVISSYSPISEWSMQSQNWMGLPDWAESAKATSLYKPGTTDGTNVRCNSGWNVSGEDFGNAQGMIINKSQAADLYVTLYVNNMGGCASDTKISVLNDATLVAYSEVTKTFDEYYNGEVIAQTTISDIGYVTFKLEGTGYFQFVAQKAENGRQAPMITGLFFNNDKPETSQSSADNVTGTNWQSTYGKDGYIVLDYDKSSNEKIAYTKGIYSDGDGAYTGKVAYTNESVAYDYSKPNTAPQWAAKENSLSLSNALVSKYGMNVSLWEYKTWLDGSDAGNGDIYKSNMLQKPDSTDRVAVRTGGRNNSNEGYAAFAFTVSDDAVKNGPLYVTVYSNNSCDGYKDDVNYKFKLYNEYHSTTLLNNRPTSNPIEECEIRNKKNTHFYSTVAISKAGDYSIVIEPDSGKARANISAVFFDKSAPKPEKNASYAINYVVEGGTKGDNPDTYEYAKGVSAFADAVPSDNGKTFKGWYQSSSFGENTKVSAIPVGMNVDMTLYAKFAKNIAITYVVGDGENAASNPVSIEGGAKFTLADAIAPEHYIFDGWYTDAACSAEAKVVGEFSSNEDVTLYAKYVEVRKINITYVLDGGVNAAGNPAWFYIGDGVAALSDATKDGYTFEGWYLDEDFDDEVSSLPASIDEDVTLYAKWTKDAVYSDVTYVLDGGVNAAANPSTYEEGVAVTLADASKEGYTFEGWYLDAQFSSKVTEISASSTGAITLYAKWTKDVVNSNITYVLDGGVNAAANPSTYEEGVAVTLAAASKEGYTFEGWYLDAQFSSKVTEISASSTGDVTLYAKFVEIAPVEPDSGNDTEEKKGCKGSLAIAPMAAVIGVAAVVVLKKRKDD